MKLLVMSDSHGNDGQLANMILEHPDMDAFIFLGDGEWDFENAVSTCDISDDRICQVRGNCDSLYGHPDKIVREFGGVRFLITHGHEQNAKLSLWGLVDEAKKQGCKAVLYGHTHWKSCDMKEGITLINPGSASTGRCCVVEVADGQIRVLNEG